ncbi:Synaptotagmin-7 [Larimichthys crocea]|uniref:Uncharacterized protein n=1 Tax=Larimichthys crocea TaxID=215358 RepID=A0ACD3QCX3_LARCR|nr:Synaptotagmin-7 [Larimichthys crocea]
MGYFAVLVDATYSDILHGAAGIMATPELTAAACVSVKLFTALMLITEMDTSLPPEYQQPPCGLKSIKSRASVGLTVSEGSVKGNVRWGIHCNTQRQPNPYGGWEGEGAIGERNGVGGRGADGLRCQADFKTAEKTEKYNGSVSLSVFLVSLAVTVCAVWLVALCGVCGWCQRKLGKRNKPGVETADTPDSARGRGEKKAIKGNKPANSPKGQPPDADGHSSVTDLANSLTGDMVMLLSVTVCVHVLLSEKACALGLNFIYPYVKVWLMHKDRRVEKKKTVTMKRCLNPVFNESFPFDVPAHVLRETTIIITVMDKDRLSRNDVIGKIYLSWKSGPAEVKHWKDMLARPRTNVAQWHALKA